MCQRREPLRAAQPLQLTMSSHRQGDEHVLALCGELELAAAGDVQDELARVEATDATLIVLDLSGLTFIDSTGIRLVFNAHVRCADQDRLSLRRASAAVQRVFRLCGVEDLLPFTSADARAGRALRAG